MIISKELKSLLENEHRFNKFTETTFKSVDKDDSGTITSEELYQILYQISSDIGANPPSREDIKEVIFHLDTDRSGELELSEFRTLIKDILKTITADENKLRPIKKI